jgi:hypothetical protein
MEIRAMVQEERRNGVLPAIVLRKVVW